MFSKIEDIFVYLLIYWVNRYRVMPNVSNTNLRAKSILSSTQCGELSDILSTFTTY